MCVQRRTLPSRASDKSTAPPPSLAAVSLDGPVFIRVAAAANALVTSRLGRRETERRGSILLLTLFGPRASFLCSCFDRIWGRSCGAAPPAASEMAVYYGVTTGVLSMKGPHFTRLLAAGGVRGLGGEDVLP